ncbi:hypothetical protein D9613_002383 [Agrocybe pediades]|uniref:Uncharacterized protein n=1 Tax=Agrocybe pediades TaxID=84607 RepID=A0A8H4R825_9AGAR|nr:hypothetical protein D9613_002383 [Agrocybe pediades]
MKSYILAFLAVANVLFAFTAVAARPVPVLDELNARQCACDGIVPDLAS